LRRFLFVFLVYLLFANVFIVGEGIGSVGAVSILFVDSSDGYIDSSYSVFAGFWQMSLGDWNTNEYSRCFMRFNLSGISGTLSSATLNLYVDRSVHDNNTDSVSPLTNPDLGDCQVIHMANYVTFNSSLFLTIVIGNDPGTLLGSAVTPTVGYVSIDVRAAMQDDIDNGRAWSAFMLKMSTNTDNDNRNDYWVFVTSEDAGAGTSRDPYIQYDVASGSAGINLWSWVLIAVVVTVIAAAGGILLWQWRKGHRISSSQSSKSLPPPPPQR